MITKANIIQISNYYQSYKNDDDNNKKTNVQLSSERFDLKVSNHTIGLINNFDHPDPQYSPSCHKQGIMLFHHSR